MFIKSTARPLAISLVPEGLLWKAILVIAGSLLIATAAQLAIRLPFSPVPVTGQTFAVLLVGAALGSRLGFAAVAAYLAEGLAGLPVFAGGASAWTPNATLGVPAIVGPSAGYLVGFAFAAFAVGWLAERGFDRNVFTAIPAMLVGEVVIYAFGLPWLAKWFGLELMVPYGLTPFIAGDLYKLVLAAVALPVAWRFVRR